MRADTISDNLKTTRNKTFNAAKDMSSDIKDEAVKVADTFSAKASEVFTAAGDVVETVYESLKDSQSKAILTTLTAVKAIDARARRRPWLFIGGALVVGSVLGYMLFHRSSMEQQEAGTLDKNILGHH